MQEGGAMAVLALKINCHLSMCDFCADLRWAFVQLTYIPTFDIRQVRKGSRRFVDILIRRDLSPRTLFCFVGDRLGPCERTDGKPALFQIGRASCRERV